MNRIIGLTALGFVLVLALITVFWWRETQLDQSEIRIPVQRVETQDEHKEPHVYPEEALRKFSIILQNRGISASEPAPFGQLPYKLLNGYVRTALAHPEIYFSENFERSSSLVAAAWLRKQRLVISPRQAWTNCLKLRWSLPRIDEITNICQLISRWAVLLFPESTIPYLSKTLKIDRPTKELVRSQRAYLMNPFNPGALENLSLDLAHAGDTVLARKLAVEMLQFDIERASLLEQELARIEGYSHPWSQFDFD